MQHKALTLTLTLTLALTLPVTLALSRNPIPNQVCTAEAGGLGSDFVPGAQGGNCAVYVALSSPPAAPPPQPPPAPPAPPPTPPLPPVTLNSKP